MNQLLLAVAVLLLFLSSGCTDREAHLRIDADRRRMHDLEGQVDDLRRRVERLERK